jgi:hypothetical protein
MTLIESCLSAGIIATVTLLAVPSFVQTRNEYLLNAAAHDVAAKLYAARVRAIARNVDCRFRVTSAVTYAVECEDPVWAVTDTVVLPRGLTVDANARPEFHRLGNVSPTATITVSGPKGRQRKVIVNNGGRVRFE